MTLSEAARLALDVQNACNLAGVLNSWARCQRALIDAGVNTSGLRLHPVNILFLSKVTSLMEVNATCIGSVGRFDSVGDERDAFGPAYEACNTLAKETQAA